VGGVEYWSRLAAGQRRRIKGELHHQGTARGIGGVLKFNSILTANWFRRIIDMPMSFLVMTGIVPSSRCPTLTISH